MTYEEALQKINDRLLFGIKPGLERIRALCDALGNPEKRTRFVHVAGTNGKGIDRVHDRLGTAWRPDCAPDCIPRRIWCSFTSASAWTV